MLPKVEAHFDKRFDILEQSVERWQNRIEERLDKKIDARFDEVIQAIRDIPEKNSEEKG